eukprot:scaffold358_cov207-Alexandrium_tamarense.AAC.17
MCRACFSLSAPHRIGIAIDVPPLASHSSMDSTSLKTSLAFDSRRHMGITDQLHEMMRCSSDVSFVSAVCSDSHHTLSKQQTRFETPPLSPQRLQ